MTRYLCKIAEVFQLKDRVVVGTDTLFDHFDLDYKGGARVQLRRPDGSTVETDSWIEMFSPTNYGRPVCFSVNRALKKEDVPVGSEVWFVSRNIGER